MENNKNNWLAFALCLLSYGFTGTVSTLMSVYLPVAIPELLGYAPNESELGDIGAYINAFFLYGWMLGGLCFGFLCDRIGRKKILAFATGLYGIATISCVFVPNYTALIACRFLAGMGIGGVLLSATVYLSEIWQAATRPIVVGILAVSFPVGIVTSGGLNLLIPMWRNAFWLGVIPCIVAVLILLFLPESENWLQAKNTAKENTKSSIFDSIYRKNLVTGTLIFGLVLIGLWGIFSWLPTWVQTLLAAVQTGQQERGIMMMLMGIGGIIGGTLSGFLIKALGIRKTLIITFLGCALACSILFLTNKTFSPIIYFETAFLSLFFGISQGSLSSYIPELFPTIIRATAAGFCFNIGRFFTATAVFFVGNLVNFFGGFGNALMLFSLAFLVALSITFFSKEPKIEI